MQGISRCIIFHMSASNKLTSLDQLGGHLGMHIMHTVMPAGTEIIFNVYKTLWYFTPSNADNFCFSGSQLNISPPEKLENLEQGIFGIQYWGFNWHKNAGGNVDLSGSLGSFGGVHQDVNDAVGGMSTMTLFSKTYPGIFPGMFFFPAAHTCVKLPSWYSHGHFDGPGLLSVLFSGLHWHGGTSTYFTQNTPNIPNDALQLNPMGHVMSGNSIFSFCPLPGKTRSGDKVQPMLDIPPEMYNPEYMHCTQLPYNMLNQW